ncbi:alpha/beta fold hydrolase [Chitinophaga sp. G-6-1-13]|uniref:Alpha/beta fold hydrolase n=1 Tax=Chitinophaga fulva TaxID=2728842 RepID=A0A848GS51_9BACT|nr:alpha/beta fold hydrolase [Chitinophaga fulva]NML39460.1 alpha/beta fold hydrolase [Chitinophaga fulva]
MKQSMILLHGLFGGLSNWEGVIQHFGSRYDIHIPSLPIYDQHNQDNLEYLVRFLEQYIEQHKLEKPVLIGNSLGGHVAILFTHRHPDKVSRLVLTGSSGLHENNIMGNYPKRGNYEYIRERVAYTFYDPAIATDALVDEVLQITRNRIKCLRIVQTAKSAQRNYVASILPEIPTPTLLIWGEEDRVSPPDVAHEFQQLLPDVQLVMLSACGHAPMMERPEQFNRILEEFLGK